MSLSVPAEVYQASRLLEQSDPCNRVIANSSWMRPMDVFLLDEKNEFLLCFNTHGIFITANGKRSREVELQWKVRPMAFSQINDRMLVTSQSTIDIYGTGHGQEDLLFSLSQLGEPHTLRYMSSLDSLSVWYTLNGCHGKFLIISKSSISDLNSIDGERSDYLSIMATETKSIRADSFDSPTASITDSPRTSRLYDPPNSSFKLLKLATNC